MKELPEILFLKYWKQLERISRIILLFLFKNENLRANIKMNIVNYDKIDTMKNFSF